MAECIVHSDGSVSMPIGSPKNRQGFTRLDRVDFERFKDYAIFKDKTRGYAVYKTTIDGVFVSHQLHNLIKPPPPGKEVDHKSRDRLDNRRKNLRVLNRSHNLMNSAAHKGSVSGCRGVRRDRNKWEAYATYKGRTVHYSRHTSKAAAIQARQTFINTFIPKG